jgi:hypothetical protein
MTAVCVTVCMDSTVPPMLQVSRAAYMSLFVYQEDAPISDLCGQDAKICKNRNPSMVKYPGKVLDCLNKKAYGNNTDTSSKSKKLTEQCQQLIDVADPPDDKSAFDRQFEV